MTTTIKTPPAPSGASFKGVCSYCLEERPLDGDGNVVHHAWPHPVRQVCRGATKLPLPRLSARTAEAHRYPEDLDASLEEVIAFLQVKMGWSREETLRRCLVVLAEAQESPPDPPLSAAPAMATRST